MQNQIAIDIEKFKAFIKDLKEKIKLTLSKKQTTATTAPGAVPAPVSSNKNTRILIIVGVIFIIAVILLIVASIIKGLRTGSVAPQEKATPLPATTIPESSVSNPSRYATDEVVLKIEALIKKLAGDLNSADLRETNLRLPDLDFDIKFE